MSKEKPKYGIGDKVEIVNYGSTIWESVSDPSPLSSYPIISNNGYTIVRDMQPELVGQQGLISKATVTQGIPQYAIEGIKGKHAWYNEGQMKMINKNPNR